MLPIVASLGLVSFFLFVTSYQPFTHYYLLQFRFYELAMGGIAAIVFTKRIQIPGIASLLIALLLCLLCVPISIINSDFRLLLILVIVTGILVLSNKNRSFWPIESKAAVFIGKISFSIYMWHQVILAYFRYYIDQVPTTIHLSLIHI